MIGVVAGFRAEARCLPQGFARVVLSGCRPGRLRERLHPLLEDGPDLLIGFGVAGALDPRREAGDLILPATVVTVEGARFAVDPDLRARVAGEAGVYDAAPLLGSDVIVGDSAVKRDLHARTGAAAVDMESHVVAAMAQAAGLPFLVVRAIADRAVDRLPGLASRALREDGSTDVVAVLGGLVSRPTDLPALIRLAWATRRALATLRQIAPRLAGLNEATFKPRG